MTSFDKYENAGAYHWQECDRGSTQFNPPLVARYEAVLESVDGGRCLEIGCGDGYLTNRLGAFCEDVVGLEYDRAGVLLANRLKERESCHFVQGSAYQLPVADSSFDCIVLADVIEHLERPQECLAEARRVLTGSGRLLVTTPQWRSDRVWDPRHVTEYRPAELVDLLKVHFQSVRMRYFWPRKWCDVYRSRLGWRALKYAGRLGFNPFTRSSDSPDGYCQMLAICSD